MASPNSDATRQCLKASFRHCARCSLVWAMPSCVPLVASVILRDAERQGGGRRSQISQNLNENLTEHEVVTWTVTGLPLTASCAPLVLRRASSESGLQGDDTERVERETHRERVQVSGSKFQDSKVAVRTEVVRDTVYIERKDSSLRVTAYGLQEDGTPTVSSKLSAVSKVLKWILAIAFLLLASVVLVRARH